MWHGQKLECPIVTRPSLTKFPCSQPMIPGLPLSPRLWFSVSMLSWVSFLEAWESLPLGPVAQVAPCNVCWTWWVVEGSGVIDSRGHRMVLWEGRSDGVHIVVGPGLAVVTVTTFQQCWLCSVFSPSGNISAMGGLTKTLSESSRCFPSCLFDVFVDGVLHLVGIHVHVLFGA